MIISELKIYNFRKFQSVDGAPGLQITFHKGLNALIGENDSGKTAVIDALKLVLLTQSNEYIRPVDEDFYTSANGETCTEFRIDCIITEFSQNEAKKFIEDKDFKGYIHDVGGPTANFRQPSCEKQLEKGVCVKRQCLFPKPCKNLRVDHSDYLQLLRKLRALPKVKKVFIRSGIRFDYLIEDKDDTFFRELIQYHVSGQLKVAPEHISDAVLEKMGKPENAVYQRFVDKYKKLNKAYGMNQFLVPYLMSSHPGSTLKEAIALAEYLRDLGYMPEQVQDFYPTPSTISTCMYYTGVDPRTMQPVYVPKNPHEKAMQRALIQYRDPKNYDLVKEALLKEHREDLIGFGSECLIRPRKNIGQKDRNREKQTANRKNGKSTGTGKKKTIRNVHQMKKKK